MTHKQVSNANRRWKRNYTTTDGLGVWYPPKLVKARTVSDASLIGIHLLNPTQDELSRAFCDAQKDGFDSIVIHTKRTFGKRSEGKD